MGLRFFRRFSILLLVASALSTLTAGQNPAGAQTPAQSSCLRIAGLEKLDDRTLAVALVAKVAGAADVPLHGKLHLYTSASQYVVNVDRTPSSTFVKLAAGVGPEMDLHVVQPAVVKIDSDASAIKGLILETAATGAACRMSEWVVSTQRPAAPANGEILEAARGVVPAIAPSATPVSLECPVPFALPHVIQAASVTRPFGQNAIGSVQVLVDLDATGHVTHASIRKSLTVTLNELAIEAAKESTYSPLLVACVSQPTSYIFVVFFQ
jgi:hypothetical protein